MVTNKTHYCCADMRNILDNDYEKKLLQYEENIDKYTLIPHETSHLDEPIKPFNYCPWCRADLPSGEITLGSILITIFDLLKFLP